MVEDLPEGWTDISIHALREEGDQQAKRKCENPTQFLSTPSARRATKNPPGSSSGSWISIHALREEGDRCG